MGLRRPVSDLDRRPITTAQYNLPLMCTPCLRLSVPVRHSNCLPMIFRLGGGLSNAALLACRMFEAIVNDLHSILRLVQGKASQPGCVIF